MPTIFKRSKIIPKKKTKVNRAIPVLDDKAGYFAGMKAAKKAGQIAVEAAIKKGITGKSLHDIRFKAEKKAHAETIKKIKQETHRAGPFGGLKVSTRAKKTP